MQMQTCVGFPPLQIVQLLEQHQHQWVIVQAPGAPHVTYVNCLEGGHGISVLERNMESNWQDDPPARGGSGGGAKPPLGVILLGPQGLARLRNLYTDPSLPLPPGNKLREETMKKMMQGTLRLIPPLTYARMCRSNKKGMNVNKLLR